MTQDQKIIRTKVGLLELAFFAVLNPLRDTSGVLLRFPINAEPVGINAHFGKSYRSFGPLVRSYVRAAGRRLVPKLWI